jgi:uncharacterized protein involved in exopolysaccharide biosynthesis
VRSELREEISGLRTELRDEVGGVRRGLADSELRLATATTQLAGDVQQLTAIIRDWRDEHRADRAAFDERLSRLEEWRAHVESRLS